MAVTWGYRLALLDSSGAQNVLGGSTPKEGPVDLILRAEDADIYIGGSNVADNLPATGFKLTVGQEYRFTVLLVDLFVATTSSSTVHLSAFYQPKI
jgi:hypothetical protein